MKNPFEKENHTTLIVTAALLTVAAGTAAFLFLTDQGKDSRKGIKKQLKKIAKDAALQAIADKFNTGKKAIKELADQVVS